MPIDGVGPLSRATILRRLHPGGGISVPTTPSHPSLSTAAAKKAPSNAKLWREDTPHCATRSPRLRLCFRTAGFGMHQDDFRPQSSRLAWFQASYAVRGLTLKRRACSAHQGKNCAAIQIVHRSPPCRRCKPHELICTPGWAGRRLSLQRWHGGEL